MLNYLTLTVFYFLYQAAFGGLFLLVGKNLQSYNHYQLLLALFASAEPIIVIMLGIVISKKIDLIRDRDSIAQKCSYPFLTLLTIMSFLLFCYAFIVEKSLSMSIGFYFIATLFFTLERIYRQRFPRDYANANNIHLHRINSINNLVTRGTPLVIPLALILFPQGVTNVYIGSFMAISLLSSVLFSKLFCKTQHPIANPIKPTTQAIIQNGEGWGLWHVIHLAVMNFAFGSMYLLLSQPVLNEISLQSYLQSPVPLYLGFVGTMIFIAFGYVKKPKSPLEGLNFVVVMGAILAIASLTSPILSGVLLFVYGILFALAINKIGTCIQQNLDHGRYSYYETRAQTYGRISSLISIVVCGYLLELGFSFHLLEFLVGLLAIIGSFILRYAYKILIENATDKQNNKTNVIKINEKCDTKGIEVSFADCD